MKKILTAFVAVAIAVGACAFFGYSSKSAVAAMRAPGFAGDEISTAQMGSYTYTEKPGDTVPGVAVTARSACLMDYGSGKVLMSVRENERYPIASMCKIMTLILIYEEVDAGRVDPEASVTVSETAAGMGGSQIFLDANESYKISDLIKGIVVASANDASVAMAELIAGSEEAFVVRMNQKAKDLGLENTNFSNCSGLPRPGQYSSALDVALMTRELIGHKRYFEYSRIWMDTLIHKGGRETGLTNTNKLVRFYKGCDGGKTGYTSEAKHCISATAVRDGMRLISVIIGADSGKERFAQASKLLNHGFANYVSKKVVDHTVPSQLTVRVRGGTIKQLKVKPAESFFMLTQRGDKGQVKLDYSLPPSIAAPIAKGSEVGKISVISGSEVVKEIPLIAADDITRVTLGGIIADIFSSW